MKLAVLALSFSLLAFPAFVTPCVAQERTTANEPKFVLDAGEIQLSALIDRAPAGARVEAVPNAILIGVRG